MPALHPAELAGRVPGADDRQRAWARAATQSAGVIGSWTWIRSNRSRLNSRLQPQLGELAEDDVRSRGVRRHGHGTCRSRSPAPDADRSGRRPDGRTARRVPGGSSPMISRVSMPSCFERLGLTLGVLADTADVRPRERHDDPDLHVREPRWSMPRATRSGSR